MSQSQLESNKMNYRVRDGVGPHRDVKFDQYLKGFAIEINNIRCIILHIDAGWIIAPSIAADDELMDDIGPFPTVDDAIVVAKLMDES